jgi:hypothetical protein
MGGTGGTVGQGEHPLASSAAIAESLHGRIDLPVALCVRTDVLGQTFPGTSAGVEFTLTFPRMPEPPIDPEILHPALQSPGERGTARIGPDETAWGYLDDQDADRAFVQALGFEASLMDNPGSSTEPAREWYVGDAFDAWFPRVTNWIELWAGHRLTGESRLSLASEGVSWDSATGIQKPWHRAYTLTAYESGPGLTSARVAAAFENASTGIEPSDAWLLVLRAQRAADARRSVIDLGTAAEVCLSRQLHDRLSALDEPARERIIRECNGLAGQLGLLQDIDGVAPEDPKRSRVMNRLAEPRNRAVHAATNPTPEERRSAHAEAKAILDRYDPLPTPED